MGAPRTKRGIVAGLSAVFLLAAIVYAPVVGFSFAYDDVWTVQGNRALDRPLAPLLRDLFAGRGVRLHVPDATRPFMVLSLWIDRRLFGSDPAGYHLHSLLLYAASSAAATLAAFALSRRWTLALVAGALFAVAPLHAEPAAAVNYREDLHAGIAVLASLSWLFAPRKEPERIDHAVVAAAAWSLGLLAKESAAVLVVLAPLLALARGVPWAKHWARVRRRSIAAYGAVFVAWGAFRGWLFATGRDDVPRVAAHHGAAERVLRTARYVSRGVFDALAPIRWSPDHAREGSAGFAWLLVLAALVALAVALVRRREHTLARGLVLALVGGLATSPLVAPVNEFADRYAFVSVLGGAIVWSALAVRLGRRVPPTGRKLALAVAVVSLLLASRDAAAPWRNDLSLWTAATLRAPTSARAFTGLAWALRRTGDLDGAERATARAIELDPSFLRARVTAIYNALARGDVAAARDRIAAVDRLGGAQQLGMRRARRCAALGSEDAPRCSGHAISTSYEDPGPEPAAP